MSHRDDLLEKVKEMISSKFFQDPDVRETESGNFVINMPVGMITNQNEREMRVTKQYLIKEYGIKIRAVMEMKASPGTYERVVELISRLNSAETRFSCLEFDYRDGEIASRACLQCEDYVPSVATIYTLDRDVCSMFWENGEQLLDAMGVDINSCEQLDSSKAKNILDEALKGSKVAQELLVSVIKSDPTSTYYPRLKAEAANGNKLAQELLKQIDPASPILERKTNKWQIVGFALSLLSCIYSPDRLVIASIGLILSAVGRTKADAVGEKTGLGTAGIALGAIGIIMSITSIF